MTPDRGFEVWANRSVSELRISLTLAIADCYHQLFRGKRLEATLPHSRPRRLARPRTPPFHGDNTGSNPVGDANLINHLQIPSRILYVRYSPISLSAWFFFVLVEQQTHNSALRVSLGLRDCLRIDVQSDRDVCVPH